MKLFLSILAALSVLLGVTIGGMWIWITAASLWESGDYWVSLIALPAVCFGAIAVIIGIRYLMHQDTANAKGIAGMVGFLVWAVLNTIFGIRGGYEEIDAFSGLYFIGQIICAIVVYRIFYWCIRKALDQEQNKSEMPTA